jgi:hypothetical protein
MCREELAGICRDMVEMAVGPRFCWRVKIACPRRKKRALIGSLIQERINHIHPMVGRTRCNLSRWRRYPDHFRALVPWDKRGLRVDEKTRSQRRGFRWSFVPIYRRGIHEQSSTSNALISLAHF